MKGLSRPEWPETGVRRTAFEKAKMRPSAAVFPGESATRGKQVTSRINPRPFSSLFVGIDMGQPPPTPCGHGGCGFCPDVRRVCYG